MANKENIEKHKFNVMDKEQKRKIQSMGGKAKAEKHRQMIKMSECLSFLMSRPLKKEDNEAVNKLLGTDGESYTNAMAIVAGVAGQARKGNVKAAYLVAQLMGDLTEKIETTTSITASALASAKVDELSDEDVEKQLRMLRDRDDRNRKK